MAKTNVARAPVFTHEGARAKHINPLAALKRSVLANLLFEDSFYEDGETTADRIAALVPQCDVEDVAKLALEARSNMNLRHVPLYLCSAMAKAHRGNPIVGDTIGEVIQRADELAELVAIHCKVNGVGPDKAAKVMGSQMKRGLAKAFPKFGAHALAKYNRNGAIKLRDVLFMCHAKPKDDEQAVVWSKLIDGTLESADTWESRLSGGADKGETFTEMLREGKLGYFALLRNLRNMVETNVPRDLVERALIARKNGAEKILPFRYVAAATAAPSFANAINLAMLHAMAEMPKLAGQTAILVDVSGSMHWGEVSKRSELSRMQAAAALAVIAPCESKRVFSFSNAVKEVPGWDGLPGIESIINSQEHGGTYLGAAVKCINEDIPHDRLIVVTDEQSHDRVPDPVCDHAYMMNVGTYQNGVGYGAWTSITGFSEAIFRYIGELEAL